MATLRVLAVTMILSMLGGTIAWGALSSVVAERTVHLPKGEVATFYSDGQATLADKKGKILRRAFVPSGFVPGRSGDLVASQSDMLRRLVTAPANSLPYEPNTVIVVFDAAVAPASDVFELRGEQLHALHEAVEKKPMHAGLSAPAYSSNAAINRSLALLGVDSVVRIARHFDRARLDTLHAFAAAKGAAAPLNIADAYRIHLTNSSVQNAVRALRDLRGIAYVSPDYYVIPAHTPPATISRMALAGARDRAVEIAAQPARSPQSAGVGHQIPSNYAISSSAQSLLNAPGVDAVKAFDEIGMAFNQLPGAGELVANVSLGDVDDTVDTSNSCYGWANAVGPTMHLINGQHYIDWPSLPLIPAYVVDAQGNASGSAEACEIDPTLTEVGLDFSMMAPLPHQLQRSGEIGNGYSDLLGIAPGAKYELFVPQDGGATESSLLEAFLAAGLSTPRPDVITASIGLSAFPGFPQRYLEDDPLAESTIATLVNGEGLVVCISANDGTEATTPAAIGSSGGSAATNTIAESGVPTDSNDLAATTIPSQDHDSGAIDSGGTTLDDLFAAPESNQLTFPETRWTGSINFSSGFGTRVDLSAPSDNVLALSHDYDGGSTSFAYDAVAPSTIGGTSASAPEIAGAVAVVLQVARLTGHPLTSPAAVRELLHATARSVPNVPQADEDVHVGPQIDLGEAVETLLRHAGKLPAAAVPRVAVAQRRDAGDDNGAFLTDTALADVDLAGPFESGLDELAPITIAPDWEGVPAGAHFRLTPVGKPNDILATTPWARVTPDEILHAIGSSSTSTASHTVELEYSARAGARFVAAYVNLTFGPGSPTRDGAPAPVVAPVTSGTVMNVAYDLTGVHAVQNPQLIVSEPGRMLPISAQFLGLPELFHPAYQVALTKLRGTVQVPVSRLQGAGVYGVAVQYGSSPASVGSGIIENLPDYTGFSLTRVVAGTSVRAQPVELSADGTSFSHTLYINYRQPYRVHWDISNVSGADGALLEIGPPAPSVFGSYNTFNNPNGSVKDDNGIDTGSYYTRHVSGASGTITLDGASTLTPALYNQVRVIPMRGSQAVGEASDPSMLGMNGFTPPDGNPLENFKFGDGGLGVVDTFLTGDAANNVFPVDSRSGAFASPLLIGGSGIYYGLEGTLFSGNLQVVSAWNYAATYSGLFNQSEYPPQYGLLNLNLSAAPGKPEWGPSLGNDNWFALPSPGYENIDLGYNRQGSLALFEFEPICNNCSTIPIYFSAVSLPQAQSPSFPPSANPLGLTFGPAYNVASAYTVTYMNGNNPETQEEAGGVSIDQTLDQGIVEVGLPLNPNNIGSNQDPCTTTGSSIVSTISLATGTITSFPGGGHGPILSTTYDPGTHVLAAIDECGNVILTNITTKQTTVHPLKTGQIALDAVNLYLSADTKNHLLLVGDSVDPTFTTNNDAGSVVQVYDESGNYLKTIHGFQFNAAYPPGYLELDETHRRLFLPELTGMMIEPAVY